jgi:uncharacterized protein YbjQ (UPF0145 family)
MEQQSPPMPPKYQTGQARRPRIPPAPGWPIHPALVTAGLEIPGYKTVLSFGIVRGLTVRSAGFGGNLSAAFESLSGGNVRTMIDMCDKARSEAFLFMLQQAAALGANAVLNFRYDTTEVGQAVWVGSFD